MDLRTLIQRKFGFVVLNTFKNGFADLNTAKTSNIFKRPPHRISADLDITTFTDTGCADVNYLMFANHTPQNVILSIASKACKRKRTPCPSVQSPPVEHLSNITPHFHPLPSRFSGRRG